MNIIHVQLIVAVLAALAAGAVAAHRPEHREPALVVLGTGFLALVVGWWLPLLVGLVVATHLVVDRRRDARLGWLVGGLVVVLIGFKVRALVTGGLLGATLFVPVGLSYLTFQLIGYAVDVRRGRTEPAESVVQLLAFCLVPPIRMSGPVLRFKDFRRSLRRAHDGLTAKRLLLGFGLIGLGLVKKRVLGDAALAHFSDDGYPLADVDRAAKAVSQLLSLYFDASGFADFAEGCGVLMGLKIPVSFTRPLTKGRSLTDFWRRWQMTVMGWFRDYVYAPIRGNDPGPGRARVALAVSFVASAAWHGLHPVWFAWGLVTVAALNVDQRLGQAAGNSSSSVVTLSIRAIRRSTMYLYLFALTTLLLAADRETFDSVRVLFEGPLTVDRTLGSVALTLGLIAALVATDAWRSRRRDLPIAAHVPLALAGIVALAWPGTIEPFVYQRF